MPRTFFLGLWLNLGQCIKLDFSAASGIQKYSMYSSGHLSGYKDYGYMDDQFPRVYVYPLDPAYNVEILSKFDDPRDTTLFQAEVNMHKWLLRAKFRVLHPESADLFYVPVYTALSLNFHGCERARRHQARKLVYDAVESMRRMGPYWDRNGGRDHVWTFPHDLGACLDFSLGRAIDDNAPEILQTIGKSIFLQYDGAINSPCHPQDTTIAIPTTIRSAEIHSRKQRPIHVYFRGLASLHNPEDPWYEVYMLYGDEEQQQQMKRKTITVPEPNMTSETELTRDRIYSNGVRQQLHKLYDTGGQLSNDGWLITNEPSDDFFAEMASSKFCLAPRGFAAWTVRTFEALASGCIPVIIADNNHMPLENHIDWRSISVLLHESDIPNLKAKLGGLSESEISAKQKAIAQTWPLLSWTDPNEGMFKLVMQEIRIIADKFGAQKA